MTHRTVITPSLKYWKPHFLSFNYVPEMGGYGIYSCIDDEDVKWVIRALEQEDPVWYGDLERCIHACLRRCSDLVTFMNDRIMEAKQIWEAKENEMERLCKSRSAYEPGTSEYYRTAELSRSISHMPDYIHKLENSRNLAILIKKEAHDMARELLEIYNKKT